MSLMSLIKLFACGVGIGIWGIPFALFLIVFIIIEAQERGDL